MTNAGARVAVTLTMLCGVLVAPAHSDVYQCGQYPNTMFYFDVVPGIGDIRGIVCDAPLEDHGQHWHYEVGGGGVAGNTGINVGVPGLQGANGGIPVGVSVTLGSATWRCPDERYESAPPMVVGTWNKERPKPLPCVAVRVVPTAPLAPWPPDTDVNLKVSWPPESNPVQVDNLPPMPPYGSTQEQAPLPNVRQGG